MTIDASHLTDREQAQVDAANASGRQPVVFVHGLWLLASSWDPWRELFEAGGYTTLAPGWPDDPITVAEAREHPEVLAGKGVGDIVGHLTAVIQKLDRKPAVVGHSFGGLFTQMLAGRGLASVAVPIDPAQFRGVLPLPRSALKTALPVLGNPVNVRRAVMLTYEQFRYAFANAVDESEAKALYETFPVPGSGKPMFQAALANLNPRTELKVDTTKSSRGPMKLISGEKDHTVPTSVASAAYNKQLRNPGVTEFEEIPGRGHSLVIDSGWEEVADVALSFIRQHSPP